MGRKVCCDAAVLASSTTVGRGLIVGLCSTMCDYVLALVPTPPTVSGVTDAVWAGMHAKAITRMLLGGVVILGAYDLGTNPAKPTEPKNVKSAASVAADVTTRPLTPLQPTDEDCSDQQPIVLVRAQAGRVVANLVSLNRSADTKSADLTIVDGLCTRVRLLRAIVPVRAAAQFPSDNDDKIKDAVLKAECSSLRAASDSLSRAVLQLTANIYVVDEQDRRPVSLALRSDSSTDGEDLTIKASLLVPIGDSVPSEPAGPTSTRMTRRIVRLGGVLSICAVVMNDATLGEVLTATRADLNRTLIARIELLKELSEEDDKPSSMRQTKNGLKQLPARILAMPTRLQGLPFCDYLAEDETLNDDILPRLSEMLSWSEKTQGEYTLSQIEKQCPFLPEPETEKIVSAAYQRQSGQQCVTNQVTTAVPGSQAVSTHSKLACGIVTAVIAAAIGIAVQMVANHTATA